MPFGFTHKPLVAVANQALTSFFRTITVFGTENVPEDGPLIFACSHANMAIDPAVLSNTLPHGHMVHYWVKDQLFSECSHPERLEIRRGGNAMSLTNPFIHPFIGYPFPTGNPAVAALLLNAGNIPVDRKNKNNQSLFLGTFEVLALGESIAVFPEGTSHTSPHMLPLRDGISWSALEYLKYLEGTGGDARSEKRERERKKGRKAMVVPVGITYIDKAKYRSSVIVQ